MNIQDILDKLEPVTESGCLVWHGCTMHGYGYVRYEGKLQRVHRLLYKELVGPISDNMALDHLCRVRCCGNVSHLEVVTSRENTLRGVGISAMYAKRTHCMNGHLFSGDNLRIDKRQRVCRECKRRNDRARRARNKKSTPPKTHCKNGHPLTGDNLRLGKKKGERICRTCSKLHSVQYRQLLANR